MSTAIATWISLGSPPRVRGKLKQATLFRMADRITPACAGKTDPRKNRLWGAEDHPRVCGENTRHWGCPVKSPGSPPRVRGKLASYIDYIAKTRITPACAGKTHRHCQKTAHIQDHPRVCGENLKRAVAIRECAGSPPRVRGKPSCATCIESSPRITPACAGKTNRIVKGNNVLEDHPRVCGEN